MLSACFESQQARIKQRCFMRALLFKHLSVITEISLTAGASAINTGKGRTAGVLNGSQANAAFFSFILVYVVKICDFDLA
jgi:hypothetical protein